jgi:hypothetical protein
MMTPGLQSRSKDENEMNFCCKIFASHLRQSGIESEIVDLLQSRVPSSVFACHYFTPSLSYRDRLIWALISSRRKSTTSKKSFIVRFLCTSTAVSHIIEAEEKKGLFFLGRAAIMISSFNTEVAYDC